jgi:SAM-dependent methyltransferase
MGRKSEISTQELAAGFYEGARYRAGHARWYHDWWTREMLSRVSVRGRVLDDGCGTGILLESIPAGTCTVVGIDISRAMLKHAGPKGGRLVLGDSQRLPFADGCFDLVIGRSLLHHLPDPALGISEMARVLRPGGEMIVVDTNASLLSLVPRALAGRSDHFSRDHKNLRAEKLVRTIRESFHVDDVVYFGYLAYPMGFPDIVDLGRVVPWPGAVTKILTRIDGWIARVPLLRTQSWGVMIKGTRRG